MPDGKEHFKFGLGLVCTLPLLAGVCAAAVGEDGLRIGVMTLVGAVGGLYFTPDMDLPNTTEPEHQLQEIPLIGKPLKYVSQGYSVLFSTHRGVSHTWLRGPMTRWGYLLFCYLWFLVLPVYAILVIGGWDPTAWLNVTTAMLAALPGAGFLFAWACQDWLHYALDGIPLNLHTL